MFTESFLYTGNSAQLCIYIFFTSTVSTMVIEFHCPSHLSGGQVCFQNCHRYGHTGVWALNLTSDVTTLAGSTRQQPCVLLCLQRPVQGVPNQACGGPSFKVRGQVRGLEKR